MMDYLRQWLREDGYAKFKEAKSLSEETSKLDPENDPYASKYKARDILKILKNKIEDFTEDSGYNSVSADDISLTFGDDNPCDDDITEFLTVDLLLIVLYFELAKNFIECEEVTTGEEYLAKCLEISASRQSSSMYCCIQISINNQLSLVWSSRGSFQKSLEYLKTAEEHYTITKCNGIDSPLNYHEIWSDEKESSVIDGRRSFFEGIHTLTLYYLAQVYMKLGKMGTSAKYCHITLVRQMETKQYDPLDWSLNCATLSQYYITQNQFTFSRYCLACAEVVNKEAFYEFETTQFSESNERERAFEKLKKSRADVYRCWAKYGLNLLQMSHSKKVGESNENQKLQDDDSVDEDDKIYRELRFPNLEVTVYEEKITDGLVQDYVSAKTIFTFSLSYLQKAKEFYKLDGYVSDNVEITQDISQFYKYIAFFDNDFETRSKMHKRRIDMLTEILVELNPKHFLQICRQLSFEIAETYSEMVFLKKAIIEEDSRKFSAHSVKKINYLIVQGIAYYTGFIDSYRKDGELPSKFEDDDIRGVLLCYFCMARLNSKYCTTDRQTKTKYLYKEKECYTFIVDYCGKHKDMPKVFGEELLVSREMLALFNGKMNSILNGMS